MDAPEISVYGEAKGEYTRQLCVFLVPCLESYFLEMLEEARTQSPNPLKILWQFQTILQGIPDWNQDKVVRETDKIQKDCKCDYLEELLTAVFIAHTKVLSAIRLTTKQKKLQITIPKLDHFIHRVLSESARTLWTNAFLFAETNSIDKQKNLRQVSGLLQESVLQGIRGLLPVKSILKEYLHDDDDAEPGDTTITNSVTEDLSGSSSAPAILPTPVTQEPLASTTAAEAAPVPEAPAVTEVPIVTEAAVTQPTGSPSVDISSNPVLSMAVDLSGASKQPTIYIDTKPSVTFSNEHVFFDSANLNANTIENTPFTEAENSRGDDAEDSLTITDEILPMGDFETLE
jgi:hypothetical protein